MKILHTSDWHLGKSLRAFNILNEQKDIIEQVKKELKKGYEALIIAGDVYDRAIPPPEAVELFGNFLDWASNQRIITIIIPGNHDSALRLNFANRSFERVYIYFRSDFTRLHEPITVKDRDGEEVDVFCIPFIETSYVRRELGDEEIKNYVDATVACIEKVKRKIRQNVPTILVSHAFVGSSIEELKRSDSERDIFVGGSGLVPVGLFEGFDYVALGHLHRSQKISGIDSIRYAGSILQYSISEANQKKSIIQLKLADDHFSISKVPLVSSRQVRVLEDKMDNLLQDEKYEVFKEDFISVKLTDKGHLINMSPRLKERFPYLLEVRQPSLEFQSQRISQPSQKVNRDNPIEIFKLFLDEFKWDEGKDREEAEQIFEKILKEAGREAREVVQK